MRLASEIIRDAIVQVASRLDIGIRMASMKWIHARHTYEPLAEIRIKPVSWPANEVYAGLRFQLNNRRKLPAGDSDAKHQLTEHLHRPAHAHELGAKIAVGAVTEEARRHRSLIAGRCSGARKPENGVLPWFPDHQAARTDSGRSSIRLRTVTAIRVSTSWAGRVCERKVSPMMRLYRLIAPSAPALAL
jgi:hypothetical protein